MNYIIREKRFYKRLATLALPVILQMLLNVSINITDTLMLSSLGEAQISASSLAGQFINLFYIICLGIGGGTSVMTAQYWGHGDKHSFRKVLTLMLRISIVISLVFVSLTLFFPRTVMTIYTSEEPIILEGLKYFKWMAFSFIFQAISQPMALVLRSARKTNVPLIATIGAFVLNIFVNWVFIFGNLGAPRLEIEGSAIGTITSYVFQAVFMAVYLLFIDKDIGYRVKNLFMPCIDLMREFIKYGAPVIFSDFLLGLGMNGITVIAGHIGGNFVTANAIAAVVQRLSTVYSQGLCSAGSVIVGNTLGEEKPERAMKEGVTCFVVSIGMGIVGALVLLILSKPFLSFYNITDETKAIAQQLMYASSVNIVFMSVSSMLTKGILRGGGDTRFLMIADIIFLWVVSIPLGALAGLVWHLPAFWIYLCMRSEMPLKSIVGIWRLFSKKWIHIVNFGDHCEDTQISD